MIDWIKRRFDQEGTLILIVLGCVVVWFLFFRPSNKQVNNSEYKAEKLEVVNNYGKGKRLTPFVEGFGGISSNGDKRAEVGARAGVRIEF